MIIPFTGVPSASAGVITGTATVTADQITMIKGGLTYANVHTTSFGGGEIRGQLSSHGNDQGDDDQDDD